MDQVSKAIISRFNWKDLRLPCTEFHVRRVYTCLNCTSFKFLKCIKAYQSNTTIPLPNSQQVADFGANWTFIPLQNSRFVSINHPPEAKPSHWTREMLAWLREIHQSFQHWPFLKLEAFMKCIGKPPKAPTFNIDFDINKKVEKDEKDEKHLLRFGFLWKGYVKCSKNWNNAFQKNTKVSSKK